MDVSAHEAKAGTGKDTKGLPCVSSEAQQELDPALHTQQCTKFLASLSYVFLGVQEGH